MESIKRFFFIIAYLLLIFVGVNNLSCLLVLDRIERTQSEIMEKLNEVKK